MNKLMGDLHKNIVILMLEVTVGHWLFSNHFRDLDKQIQFAKTNLLHISMGKSIIVCKNAATFNEWPTSAE